MRTFVVLLFVACIVVTSARYVWLEDEKVEKKAHKGKCLSSLREVLYEHKRICTQSIHADLGTLEKFIHCLTHCGIFVSRLFIEKRKVDFFNTHRNNFNNLTLSFRCLNKYLCQQLNNVISPWCTPTKTCVL